MRATFFCETVEINNRWRESYLVFQKLRELESRRKSLWRDILR